MKAPVPHAATFFFAEAPAISLEALADRLRAAFAASQIRIEPRYRSGSDLIVAIGRLTLTITLHPASVDLSPYIRATAAGTDFGLSPARQRALVAHRGAVVLRITGPEGAALSDTRAAICFLAALEVMALDAPLMIHWASSQSLYTRDEFYTQSQTVRPDGPQSESALRGCADATEQARALEQLRLDALRERCFPASDIRTRGRARDLRPVRLHIHAGALLVSATILGHLAAMQALAELQIL